MALIKCPECGRVDAQIRRGCEHIGINVKTMHKKRKTYGSALLSNGVNISVVKDMLGHTDEATTLRHYIYNTIANKEIGEIVLNALSGDEVTKSDQKIISFSGKKKAENLNESKHSAIRQILRKMGLEPTRHCCHKILSLARLPVPTLPPIYCTRYILTLSGKNVNRFFSYFYK